ncbi:MAG: 50S ribosomal protein L21 [Deltaproteobacteria bacterium]|nr:50S ribosomal protein L21 [Deltaproteobacteria bacterium]
MSRYAVIKTGGKQYTVSEGDFLKVEKLPGKAGDSVELAEVVAIGGEGEIKIGAPLIKGSSVVAHIREQAKRKKVIIFKKRRRKGYTKKQGHRQEYTGIVIKEIK